MFRPYLESIEGISIYPLFSFVVFFVFFLAVAVWAFRADKGLLDEMSRLPLQSESEPSKSDLA